MSFKPWQNYSKCILNLQKGERCTWQQCWHQNAGTCNEKLPELFNSSFKKGLAQLIYKSKNIGNNSLGAFGKMAHTQTIMLAVATVN